MSTLQRLFGHLLNPPVGRNVRDLVALLSVVQGILRIVPGVLMGKVNIIPSPVYGWIMLTVGIMLFFTGETCHRLSWLGRITAALGACVWLLLSLDVMGVSTASCSIAFIFAIAAANEVRANEC